MRTQKLTAGTAPWRCAEVVDARDADWCTMPALHLDPPSVRHLRLSTMCLVDGPGVQLLGLAVPAGDSEVTCNVCRLSAKPYSFRV